LLLADYILEYLKSVGIKQVFQVYGAATGDIVDAFSRVKDIQFICPIHEQAGSFMVETIAKVTGKMQCFMATSGPGGINTLDGIANCYYDSVPALFITGQINSRFMRKTAEQRQIGFQENDIVSMAKPITKFAEMVKNPEDIKYLLDKAVYLANHGRKAPVLLDIPTDIQKIDIDPTKLRGYTPHEFVENPQWYDSDAISLVVKALKKAKRPVLLIGGGVHWSNAEQEVRKLGALLKIPCIPTWNALDIITSDYPYYAGRIGTFPGAGRNFTIQNTDLVIAIGSRISGRITGGQVKLFAREAFKVIVDVDPAMLDIETQEVKGDLNYCCDAKKFVVNLMKELRGESLPRWDMWVSLALEWRDKYPVVLPEYYKTSYVHPYAFMKELSKECKEGDIIVSDSGGNCVVASTCFETKWGQRLLSSNGNSTMGYSFSGAMGLCFLPEYIKEQKGRIICIIGDGGMQMNIQELQTIKHYGLRLKTFICQNFSYGITTQFQRTNYGNRLLASGNGDDIWKSGYSVPDFCKVAEGYGVYSTKIDNMDELNLKIQTVLQADQAVLCEVNMKGHTTYEPRIFGWKTPIDDVYPYTSREEYRNNMIIKPYDGWEHPAVPGNGEVGLGLS